MLRVRSPLRPYGATAGAAAAYTGDLRTEVERYAAAVDELAADETFDVIHAHDWMTLPAALRVRERSGRPLVWHVHSTELDRNGPAADPAIRALEQIGLDAADRVVVVSRYTADLLARHYRVDPGRLRVVHNAVRQPATRHARRRRPDEPLVLFLGRLTAQKGPGTFLRAAARVARARERVRFVVAGSGDLYPDLVAEAERLGLGRRVHFTGFLEGEDVERMYSLADVYVMPSHSEPFGIAALEAMCAETPVIVSERSGVAEVLTNSLKVAPGDDRELASLILAVLERPALRESLVANGNEDVKRLRWDVRARALLEIYAELAA
jgi:glycosyltransferase involved in cell wall biosynthesis